MNLLVNDIKSTPFASAIQEAKIQLINCKRQLKSVQETIELLMDQDMRQQKIDALKMEVQSIRTNNAFSERKRKRLLSEKEFELRYLRRLSEPSIAHQLYRNEYELEARLAHLTAELDHIHQNGYARARSLIRAWQINNDPLLNMGVAIKLAILS